MKIKKASQISVETSIIIFNHYSTLTKKIFPPNIWQLMLIIWKEQQNSPPQSNQTSNSWVSVSHPYLPMYPSHASPSLPGPHSHWTQLQRCDVASLPDSFLCVVHQPVPWLAGPPLTVATALQQLQPLSCLVTWPHSSSPGVTAGLEVQWQPGVIWVELIVPFLLPFNNTKPGTPLLRPSPKLAPLPSMPMAFLRRTKVHVQAQTHSIWQNTHTLTTWSTWSETEEKVIANFLVLDWATQMILHILHLVLAPAINSKYSLPSHQTDRSQGVIIRHFNKHKLHRAPHVILLNPSILCILISS